MTPDVEEVDGELEREGEVQTIDEAREKLEEVDPDDLIPDDLRDNLVPLDDLTPYVNNPKEHPDSQVKKLASSIRNFRWDVPMVVDETGEIVKGHGRYAAAEFLGFDEVPVVVNEYESEAEKRAARIADNRVAESPWDDELLGAELEWLDDSDVGVEMTAFDEGELDDFLDEDDPDDMLGGAGILAREFLVPPFSVLDTRQGYWWDRKTQWKELGLDEFGDVIGREAGLVDGGGSMWDGSWQKENIPDNEQGLGAGSDGTSVFDPVLAELLYRWFSPGRGSTTLDPFAGGPARGTVAATIGLEYHGVDLNPAQVEANYEFVSQYREPFDAAAGDAGLVDPSWYLGDAAELDDVLEDTDAPDEVDFVMSCPPYHDLEQYTDDPRDLSNMSYETFLETYREAIAQAVDRLAEDRFAAFVVGDVRDDDGRYRGFPEDTVEAFTDAGAELYNRAILVAEAASLPARARGPFEASRKLGKQHQTVLVFYKGDMSPETIRDAMGDVHVPPEVWEREAEPDYPREEGLDEE